MEEFGTGLVQNKYGSGSRITHKHKDPTDPEHCEEAMSCWRYLEKYRRLNDIDKVVKGTHLPPLVVWSVCHVKDVPVVESQAPTRQAVILANQKSMYFFSWLPQFRAVNPDPHQKQKTGSGYASKAKAGSGSASKAKAKSGFSSKSKFKS